MPAKPTGAAKIMDVTHPRNTQPDTTSRPVIVTNRPMIAADPMIAQSAADVLTKSGAEKTTSQTEVTSRGPELVVDRETDAADTSLRVASSMKAATQVTSADEPTKIDDGLVGAPPVDRAAVKTIPKPVVEATGQTQTTLSSNDAKPENLPSEPDYRETTSVPRSELAFTDADSEELVDEDLRPQTDEQKQQKAMEALIASGKYAVPIGRIAKRRARVVLLVISTILLILLAIDILLDMGIISLLGIPHTTFFSI